VVLRLVGFGVVTVVGLNPAKAQVGNIAIKITHNGCVSKVRVWVKAHDGASGCTQVQNYSNSSISPHTSHGSTHIVSDKTKEIPRVQDI
jgi:hypothetical protein